MNRRHYLQSLSALFATTLLGSCAQGGEAPQAKGEQPEQPQNASGKTQALSLRLPDDSHSFLLVSDLGRNGYYKQKPIAELMGNLASKVDIECVVAAGDTHHFNGVASIDDPLWMTNYELIYAHPELMIDWFALNGNHEYRGNTQAVLDYGKKSRRWVMPARYYSQTFEAGEQEEALLLFIDTTPLIDKYRKKGDKYPDAGQQDKEAQLRWIEQTLSQSQARWKIVIGHHPLYAYTDKEDSERSDMRQALEALLERYGVDCYCCGHIHSFQHIKPEGATVDYLVNSSGSLTRPVKAIEGTQFCSPDEGFTLVNVADNQLTFYLINDKGEIIYQFSRQK
ncbi:MAG: metallophosphoesterase [bacterium]|nr:metallophosphoesterase [bacterium]